MIMSSQLTRPQLIERCFQRGPRLTTSAPDYLKTLDSLLQWLLDADQVTNDQTTRLLDLRQPTTAAVISKQSGIVAGIDEVVYLIGHYTHIHIVSHLTNGQPVAKGDTVLSIAASMNELLAYERVILNILGRLSGIATMTHHLIGLASVGSARVAGTRKAPWMHLDKSAIFAGGGLTHRLNLADGVLIKDNHLESFRQQLGSVSVSEAITVVVERAMASSHECVEIEVESPEQGRAVLAAFDTAIQDNAQHPALVVMLDNFDPAGATSFIDEIRSARIYPHMLFEVSGDVTEDSIGRWSQTGADVVSLGALTHSVKNFNLSMAMQ